VVRARFRLSTLSLLLAIAEGAACQAFGIEPDATPDEAGTGREEASVSVDVTSVEEGGAARTGEGEISTARYDNARTGANLHETVLRRDNVDQLTLIGVLPADGEIYAQPLVVPDVVTPSGRKNLVLVATMSDSVFAYDLDAPSRPPVWRAGQGRELGRPGSTVRNVVGNNGILSTPVVDRARGLLYLVARDCDPDDVVGVGSCGTQLPAGRCSERVVALTLEAGEVRAAVTVEGSVDVEGVTTSFDAQVQWNRPALLLAGDSLYVAFGSGPNGNQHEEDFVYHGWVFRYDVKDWSAPPEIFNSTPRGRGGSVWQGGAGPAADDLYLYFATANRILACATFPPESFPARPDGAEDSVVRLPLTYSTASLGATDAGADAGATESEGGTASSFGPARIYSDTRPYSADGHQGDVFQFTNAGDVGFGSSGPTLIPDSRDLVVGTKGGLVYLLDRDTMLPRQEPLSPFDVLPLQGDHTLYIHSWWGIPMVPGSLVFYRPTDGLDRGFLYAWPYGDKLRRFVYDYERRSLASDRAADVPAAKRVANLALTADGTTPGSAIVWAITAGDGDSAHVWAFDALTLDKLWDATTPGFAKWTPPTIARGRLLVPSSRQSDSAVLVYGIR
jgi:hypothetical protein